MRGGLEGKISEKRPILIGTANGKERRLIGCSYQRELGSRYIAFNQSRGKREEGGSSHSNLSPRKFGRKGV